MQEATEGFEVFVHIVQAGSISAAARALSTPRETLSRQLGRLEERLGVRLVHRGPRRLVLTRAGETLFERAERLVLAAREAEAAVRQLDDTPKGLLRISVPAGGGRDLNTPMVLAFMARWPEVRVEMLATNRYVDLIAEGVDVALRAGQVREPSLIARRLWHDSVIAVATPAYLDAFGRPEGPDDLASHRCICGMGGGERPNRQWPTLDGGAVSVEPWFACNAIEGRVRAVMQGAGIAMVLRQQAAAAIAAGHLEPVLPKLLGTEMSISLVYVERTFMPPKVRAFIDFALNWIARHPPWLEPPPLPAQSKIEPPG